MSDPNERAMLLQAQVQRARRRATGAEEPQRLGELLKQTFPATPISSPLPAQPAEATRRSLPTRSGRPTYREREAAAWRERVMSARCVRCLDRGFVMNLETPCDCETGQQYALQRAEAQIRRLVDSGLAETLADKRLETFDAGGNGRILEACANRADGQVSDGEKPGLLLQGPCGCGKTHLMAGMAHRYLTRGVPVVFEVWSTLIRKMQDGFDDGSYMEILQGLQAAPVVMIDDLGAEYSKRETGDWRHNWVSAQLYDLVDARFRQQLPLIVSTNLDLDQLSARYGERVYSRLIGLCAIARVTGRDRRIEQATLIYG